VALAPSALMSDAGPGKRARMLVENFDEDPSTGRRRLVGLSELDAGRDLVDFSFVTDGDQEAEPVQYFLDVQGFGAQGLRLGINYTNPLAVGQNNDNIMTGLKDVQMFRPASGNPPVAKADSVTVKASPPQVPAGVDEAAIKVDASTACKAIVGIVVAMMLVQVLVAKGKLSDFWGLFFILQLICYCAFYTVKIPGNVDIYTEELTKVVEFSALNPDYIIRLWNAEFNIAPDSVADQDQLVSVWDDVKVYLLILAVFAVVVAAIGLAAICSTRARSALATIKDKVVLDYSLQFLYMVYIKICITVMNQIDLAARGSDFWNANDANWGIFLGVLLFAAPIAMWAFLARHGGSLHEESVKARYENLYADAALHRSPLAKFYSVAFAVRRIIFIALPVMLRGQPFMQVAAFILVHTLYLIAYLAVKPHADAKRSCLELFNEVCLMFFLYHMAGWSGLIVDLQARFDMGWSYIGFVLLVLTVNAGVIIYNTTEQWRHTRAVDLNRKLVLEHVHNMETIMQDDADKKAVRMKIRDEFIKKRMMESEVPMPDNKVHPATSQAKKKSKSKKPKKGSMGTIDEGVELTAAIEAKAKNRGLPVALPNAVNVLRGVGDAVEDDQDDFEMEDKEEL